MDNDTCWMVSNTICAFFSLMWVLLWLLSSDKYTSRMRTNNRLENSAITIIHSDNVCVVVVDFDSFLLLLLFAIHLESWMLVCNNAGIDSWIRSRQLDNNDTSVTVLQNFVSSSFDHEYVASNIAWHNSLLYWMQHIHGQYWISYPIYYYSCVALIHCSISSTNARWWLCCQGWWWWLSNNYKCTKQTINEKVVINLNKLQN